MVKPQKVTTLANGEEPIVRLQIKQTFMYLFQKPSTFLATTTLKSGTTFFPSTSCHPFPCRVTPLHWVLAWPVLALEFPSISMGLVRGRLAVGFLSLTTFLRICWNYVWSKTLVPDSSGCQTRISSKQDHVAVVHGGLPKSDQDHGYPGVHSQAWRGDWSLDIDLNKEQQLHLFFFQAIYFPDKWWHATLNLDTSVFISTFLSPWSSDAKHKAVIFS